MIYHSTRDENITASSTHAVLQGIAPDGGLYICDPAALRFDWRGALEKEIGGLYENAAVTGFSAAEVDVSTRMDVPCPLHWVLRAGDDGLLAVLQNTTGETLTVVRRTDIPVALAAGEEQDELRDGRMFDDVQALEGYLESLSS